jgi:hypothetical protein
MLGRDPAAKVQLRRTNRGGSIRFQCCGAKYSSIASPYDRAAALSVINGPSFSPAIVSILQFRTKIHGSG